MTKDCKKTTQQTTLSLSFPSTPQLRKYIYHVLLTLSKDQLKQLLEVFFDCGPPHLKVIHVLQAVLINVNLTI